MPKFRVYAKRAEVLCATIEAKSSEEAEKLADKNYSNYNWFEIDDSLNTKILYGDTEEDYDDDE